MTRYFYDTEFLDDGYTIHLISIGIVSDDGREYYAVNADMDVERILKNPWLVENVWRHLPVRGMRIGPASVNGTIESRVQITGSLDRKSSQLRPRWLIANEVRDFLRADQAIELWADYAAYDHVVLAQLWGSMMNLPEGIPMWTHDIQQLLELAPGFIPPEQQTQQHMANLDARYAKDVYDAVQKHLLT